MRLSAIEKGKKRLCILTFDEGTTAEVDARVVEEEDIAVGAWMTEEGLEELLARSRSRRAWESALYYLSGRDYSRGELEQKLRRDHAREDAAAAVDRCVELGLIDDARYAGMLSRDLANLRDWSSRHILQELSARGIDRETAAAAVEALDLDDTAQAVAVLRKKYTRALTTEDGRRKTAAALARLGFDYRTARRAMETVAGTDLGDAPDET